MPISPEQKDHAHRLAAAGTDPDAFDAILMGADAMRDYPGSFASHKRRSDDGLTYGLAVAKMGTDEEIKVFHDKGGLFTDQRDRLGRIAEDILTEFVQEAKRARIDPVYRDDIGFKSQSDAELDEVIFYRAQTLDAYHHAVALQGGLVHIDEQQPLRNDPPIGHKPDILGK